MSMQVFIDSNILIYAYDRDGGDKHLRAKKLITEIWKTRRFPALSIQVLQEAHVNFVRKGVSVDESVRIVSRYLAFRIVENSRILFMRSLEIQQKYKLSFWDASIVAAAQRSQARELWTEDLNEGQKFDGVTIRNPLKS